MLILRPDILGRWLAAIGLMRIADERGVDLRLSWTPYAAVLDGDVDALIHATAVDAAEAIPEDAHGSPLWLLAGRQTWSTTLTAAIPLLTPERIRTDLATGARHPDVATLRMDAEYVMPAALQGYPSAPGSGSRGCPTLEYLTWRAIAQGGWCPPVDLAPEDAVPYGERLARRVWWPVWGTIATPAQLWPWLRSRPSWAARARLYYARVHRPVTSAGHVAPGQAL